MEHMFYCLRREVQSLDEINKYFKEGWIPLREVVYGANLLVVLERESSQESNLADAISSLFKNKTNKAG